jgi:hypothetical protein
MLLSHPSPAGQRPAGLSIRPNPASPQAANLIAWWPMAAPFPRLFDAAQQRYPSALEPLDWVPTPLGGWAVRFDGTKYWNWGDQAAFNFGNNPFAISCWAWFTGSTVSFLVSKRASGDVGYDLVYGVGGAGTLQAIVQHDVTPISTGDTTGLNDGNYHHVVFGYDGALVRLIVDGGKVSIGAATAGGSVNNTQSFQFGARGGANLWTGRMFDVRVYLQGPTTAFASQMYQPATRWQLYQTPSRRLWLDAPAAAAAEGALLIGGNLLHSTLFGGRIQ